MEKTGHLLIFWVVVGISTVSAQIWYPYTSIDIYPEINYFSPIHQAQIKKYNITRETVKYTLKHKKITKHLLTNNLYYDEEGRLDRSDYLIVTIPEMFWPVILEERTNPSDVRYEYTGNELKSIRNKKSVFFKAKINKAGRISAAEVVSYSSWREEPKRLIKIEYYNNGVIKTLNGKEETVKFKNNGHLSDMKSNIHVVSLNKKFGKLSEFSDGLDFGSDELNTKGWIIRRGHDGGDSSHGLELLYNLYGLLDTEQQISRGFEEDGEYRPKTVMVKHYYYAR